jgi:uroporphyrinogen III methyltransferase / synthase
VPAAPGNVNAPAAPGNVSAPAARSARPVREQAGDRDAGHADPRADRQRQPSLPDPGSGTGTVYLVGAGPGDPGLVTARALELVGRAEVLAYDRLAAAGLIELAPAGCELVDVGKAAGGGALTQERINAFLVERARQGRLVVRLKGGDPFVFGRGGEEAEACAAAGVPFEVVPGVSSAYAAPAWAGIPVTHRGLATSVTVVTGHDPGAVDWAALARTPGTLCVLMGAGNLAAIAAALTAGGRDGATPAALVRWGTTARQQVVTGTLATIAREAEAAAMGPPAVLVVGEVAALRERVAWAERRPLNGTSVLVPRARQQAGTLSRLLTERGAEAIELPLIAIRPPASLDPLDRAIAELARGAYAWIGLTSVNGVAAVRERAEAAGHDARLLAGARIAAVGPGTRAALRAWGINPDLEPARATTAELAAAFPPAPVPPGDARPVLLPRSDLANPELSTVLRGKGWDVVDVVAYRTVPLDEMPASTRARLDNGEIGWLAFTAASTVQGFLRAYGGPPPKGTRVAVIGPVTAAAAAAAGLPIHARAHEHTIPGLVAAIEHAVAGNRAEVRAFEEGRP